MQENTSKNNSRKSVLVLGQDIRAFLAIIRSLGRYGIEVHVGMCRADDVALKSKYVTRYHEIPDHSPDNNQWLETIIRLSAEHKFDLIIPTNDESVVPVQLCRDEIKKYALPYVLNDRAFDIAFDKIKSSVLAQQLGLMLPAQREVAFDNYCADEVTGITFPIVAKPPSSFSQDDLGSRREVAHIANPEELALFAAKHKDWGQALLQEYFAGIGAGVEILAHRGKILFAFQHIRVHEPLDGGASSYRKSVPLNQILATASRKLIRALEYSGVAMIEFKLNTETGQWIFIEINSRFWGSLPLAVSAGANFPLYLYQHLVEGKTDFSPHYRSEIYSRNLLRDLYWFSDNFKARRQKPPPKNSIPLNRVFGELGHIITGRDRIDSFAFDDPKPGLEEFGAILGAFWGKISAKARSAFLEFPPVRRRIAKKILRQCSGAETILFVCYGNICRSSFAELYARNRMPDAPRFRSSGFHDEDGRTSPDLAIKAAHSLDIDMTEHRSNTIDEDQVSAADVIFVFDQKNRNAMAEHFPQALAKTHYLGFLCERGPIEIEDPYAHNLETFGTIYRSVAQAVSALAIAASPPELK